MSVIWSSVFIFIFIYFMFIIFLYWRGLSGKVDILFTTGSLVAEKGSRLLGVLDQNVTAVLLCAKKECKRKIDDH